MNISYTHIQINEVLKYLGSKPFNEVVNLIELLKGGKEVETEFIGLIETESLNDVF